MAVISPTSSIAKPTFARAQSSPAGNDIATLMNKAALVIYYAEQVGASGTVWTPEDDTPDATSMVHGITDHPAVILMEIAQAERLILADLLG